jgi:uncharacterized protein YndB with AHSA1/START domain
MTSKLHHDTFTIERTYGASPKQVFAAWANPEAKARWFAGPSESWSPTERSMDFRVGGQERAGGLFKDTGTASLFVCTYLDIVDQERIIYSYEMFINGLKISVSLASIQLRATASGGTHMTVTEHGAYFEGSTFGGQSYTGCESAESRLRGTEGLIEQFGASFGEPSKN